MSINPTKQPGSQSQVKRGGLLIGSKVTVRWTRRMLAVQNEAEVGKKKDIRGFLVCQKRRRREQQEAAQNRREAPAGGGRSSSGEHQDRAARPPREREW